MTKYTFEFANIVSDSGSGYKFNICLLMDRKKSYGTLKCQTWLQGCGLNGLEGFHNVSWPDDCVPSFLKFLAKIRSGHPENGTWLAKRFLFSLSDSQLDYDFAAALAAKSELLTKVPNLAHGPNDIHLFLLTTK